jgi:hypothetical protein
VNGDVPATMDVNVTMPVQFKALKRYAQIDGGMFVGTVFKIIRFSERLFVLANKDEQITTTFVGDSGPSEQIPNAFVSGRGDNQRLCALSVNE